MTVEHGYHDAHAVLALIVSQQGAPETACAYLGHDAEDIREDLDDLDQPWLETLRVCTDEHGRLTGAVLVEWDEETGHSWVHGPWATAETWDRDAAALLAAVTAQVPVTTHEMYGDVRNQRMARLADEVGWRAGVFNSEYGRPRAGSPRTPAGVRPAAAGDLAAIGALHEREFPETYATPRQLLDPEGPYTVMVVEAAGAVVGFIAGQENGGDTYIDFVAVDAEHRRRGLGAALISALEERIGADRTRLTVDEERPGSGRFYASLGFELLASTRPYRSS